MNGMDSFHCLTSQLLIDCQAAANKHFKVASSVCIKCLHLDTTLTAAFQSYSHRWSSDHLSQVYSHCRQNLAANFYAESAEDMQMFPKIFSESQTFISVFKAGWHLKQLNYIFPIVILKKQRAIQDCIFKNLWMYSNQADIQHGNSSGHIIKSDNWKPASFKGIDL